jgi:glycosyltransferase involved in cell wall biosynthesis
MPASLLAALEETVGDAIPLRGDVPHAVTRLAIFAGVAGRSRPAELLRPRTALANHRPAAMSGRAMVMLTSAAVRARLALAGRLDGCVLVNTEFSLPASLRTVTFQDSTLMQASRSYPWPHLRGWSERDRALAIRRQSAIYRRAVACTAMSHWAARSIVKDYGTDPAKVHVVGLGPNQPVRLARARDWSVPHFLFVGFDWERKNGDAVLDAFTQVRVEHPDATLDLVGGHPRVDLEGVTGHGPLSLADDGGRARLAALYDRATALVLPSFHEPSATVHLEAGHAGIPSIGSSNGGAETVIGPGGYIVHPGHRQELVEAMLKLAEPGHAAEMGLRASEHAQLFTWRRLAERLIRALAPPGVDCSALAEFL